METAVGLLAAGALALAGCRTNAANAADAGFPVTVYSCDREVTFEKPPQRVLTQGPEAPVLVAAVGAADRLIARNGEYGSPVGEYERVLRDVPILGTNAIGEEPLSREEVIAQQPDLVINRGSEVTPEDLAADGIDGLVVDGRCTQNNTGIVADGSLEQIYNELEKFGRIFGTQDIAAETIAELRARVAAVEDSSRDVPDGTTAAALIIVEPFGAYGNLAVINAQMDILGLTNVFEDQPERYFEPSIEEIIDRDPDVIIVLTGGGSGGTPEEDQQTVLSQPEFAGVTAVRDGHVFALPFAQATSSPLAIEGLEILARQLAAWRLG